MTIDVLGDRRNTGFCLKCGTLLIQPYNDYQCCSECTKFIEKALYQFEQRRKRENKMGSILVSRKQIGKQMMPIGVPVK